MVVDRTAMIAADYWAVWWRPRVGVTAADLDAVLEEHLAWMLGLEREGHVLASGPITSGPGASAGSGLTVLRAGSLDDAARLAAQVVKAYVDKQRRQPVKVVQKPQKNVEMGAVWSTTSPDGHSDNFQAAHFTVDIPKRRLPLAVAAPGLTH